MSLQQGSRSMERSRSVELFAALSRVVAQQQDTGDLLQVIPQQFAELFPSTQTVFLFLRAQDALVLTAMYPASLMPAESFTLEADEGPAGRTFATQQREVCEGKQALMPLLGGLSSAAAALYLGLLESPLQPTHQAVALPLAIDGQIVGVAELHSVGEPYSVDELAVLQGLGTLVAATIRRCQLRDELERAQISLQTAYTTGDVLAVLSHQLRSPLAAIKGYASTLLRDDVAWDKDEVRDFLETIVRQADNATMVITDILDNSALETGVLTLNREPVLLRNLCEKIINELRLGAPDHRFVLAFAPDFPLVQADAARIEQVVRNLLDNAIKYSDGGFIVVHGEERRNEVIMSVADEGIGIQPEHLNRLFEKFYRIKNANRNVIGTGLGLPIARKIVEAHHGRIWATSKVGSGTTFNFTLPTAGAAAEERRP